MAPVRHINSLSVQEYLTKEEEEEEERKGGRTLNWWTMDTTNRCCLCVCVMLPHSIFFFFFFFFFFSCCWLLRFKKCIPRCAVLFIKKCFLFARTAFVRSFARSLAALPYYSHPCCCHLLRRTRKTRSRHLSLVFPLVFFFSFVCSWCWKFYWKESGERGGLTSPAYTHTHRRVCGYKSEFSIWSSHGWMDATVLLLLSCRDWHLRVSATAAAAKKKIVGDKHLLRKKKKKKRKKWRQISNLLLLLPPTAVRRLFVGA